MYKGGQEISMERVERILRIIISARDLERGCTADYIWKTQKEIKGLTYDLTMQEIFDAYDEVMQQDMNGKVEIVDERPPSSFDKLSLPQYYKDLDGYGPRYA